VLLKHWGELFHKMLTSVSLLLRLLDFFRLIVSIIELTPRELKWSRLSESSGALGRRPRSRLRVETVRATHLRPLRPHDRGTQPQLPDAKCHALLKRSSRVPTGLQPTSRRNASKLRRHRGQIVTPRPP
jgi:hypothetical protein